MGYGCDSGFCYAHGCAYNLFDKTPLRNVNCFWVVVQLCLILSSKYLLFLLKKIEKIQLWSLEYGCVMHFD